MKRSDKTWRGSVKRCCEVGFHLAYGTATFHVAMEDLEGMVLDLCELLQSASGRPAEKAKQEGERLH